MGQFLSSLPPIPTLPIFLSSPVLPHWKYQLRKFNLLSQRVDLMKMNWDGGPITFQQGSLCASSLGRINLTAWQHLLASSAWTLRSWEHNAGTVKVWGCGSQHTQYNPLQESARHTEMSLKDNSGLCYKGENGIKATQWPASVEWVLCREFYFVLYARNLDPTLCVKQGAALWRGADQDHSHYCAGSQTSEAYHHTQ